MQDILNSLYLPLQSGEVDGTVWQNLLPEQIAYKMVLLLVMAMQMLENDGELSMSRFTCSSGHSFLSWQKSNCRC